MQRLFYDKNLLTLLRNTIKYIRRLLVNVLLITFKECNDVQRYIYSLAFLNCFATQN